MGFLDIAKQFLTFLIINRPKKKIEIFLSNAEPKKKKKKKMRKGLLTCLFSCHAEIVISGGTSIPQILSTLEIPNSLADHTLAGTVD